MTCPNCGANIPTGSTNCGSCGARFRTEACPNCGRNILAGSTECMYCHKKIKRAQTAAPGNPQSGGKALKGSKPKGAFRWWQIPIYIVVFLIGIGVGSSYTKHSIRAAVSEAFNDSLSSQSKPSKSTSESSKEAPESSKSTEKTQPTSAANGTLGDYEVSILEARSGKDYDGNPVIIVGYKFTNNSDENKSFMLAVHDQAFQNGVQLEPPILLSDDTEYNAADSMKEVQPGGTIEVEQAYILQDETNEVTVEVEELFSMSDDMLTKKFPNF